MASITPMSFFTPDATINPDEFTFEIVDAAARGSLATIETSTTASKPYTVGDFLLLNGILYRVTDTIAQDGAINPAEGGNVVETTVENEFRKRGKIMETSSVQSFLTDLGDLANGDSRFYFIPWRSINTQDGLDAQNTFVFGTKYGSVINAIAVNLSGKTYSIENSSSTWTPTIQNLTKDCLQYKGVVTTNNADYLVESGIYYNETSLQYSIPSFYINYSHFIVINYGGVITQLAINAATNMAFRKRSGAPATWSSWINVK